MPRRVKREKPYIIVFCEGESEQASLSVSFVMSPLFSVRNPPEHSTKQTADSVTTPNTSIMLRLRIRSGSSLMWKPLTFGSRATGCG